METPEAGSMGIERGWVKLIESGWFSLIEQEGIMETPD
jgi:hypothetical protein